MTGIAVSASSTCAYGLGRYQIEEYCRERGNDVVFMEWLNNVRRVQADIEKVDFDDRMKREIRLTAWMIELGSEICKVKLSPAESAPRADELVALIDRIAPEFEELWKFRNYEKGVERFLSQLADRRAELLALK